MTEILMPRLMDAMEEGTILRWIVTEGGAVEPGDDLVEIETDKSVVTHPADAAGIVHVVAAEGAVCAVGAVIATLGSSSEAPPPRSSPPVPEALVAAATTLPEPSTVTSGPEGGSLGADIAATPLARRLAESRGVDLATLSGTGPRGRITQGDVLLASGGAPPAADRTAPPSADVAPARKPPAAAPVDDDVVVALSRLQQTVARRMSQAKSTIPHFQVQATAVVDDLLALRRQLVALEDPGLHPSVNDLLIKACGLTLREHPRVNGSYSDEGFRLHPAVNVGFAVSTDDGLIVPTVPDAAGSGIGLIAQTTRRLAEEVRAGTIKPADLGGATFTVSNLGMFGMSAVFPVVNPPQAAILGVGAARPELALVDGAVVERSVMTLTLSCDHRILYGADAAKFLATLVELLEAPLRLLL